MTEIWTVFAIIAGVIVLFMWGRLPVILVSIGSALALHATGVTAWAGQILIGHAGYSRTRLIVPMMLFVGALSALISTNAAVAALLPVVVVMAVRLERSPSQLLMPLVFGAHSGSMLALTGTPRMIWFLVVAVFVVPLIWRF